MHSSAPLDIDRPGIGRAQERHFPQSIFESAAQQRAQQEAVRSRHGSSASQTMHHDGRTIRSASRPKYDNALATRLGTRTLYSSELLLHGTEG